MPQTAEELVTNTLQQMEREWTMHGGLGEPYSDSLAIEILLNEIIDFANYKGLAVRLAPNHPDIDEIKGVHVEHGT